jgi:NAD(P)H-flavin reductase
MATTISKNNVNKPAPKWYRIFRHVVYGLFTGTLFTGLLQRFGVSDSDVILICGYLISVTETLGLVLANGEKYTKV